MAAVAAMAAVSCKKRGFNADVKQSTGPDSSGAKGSWIGASYPQTRPTSFFSPVPAGLVGLGFSPITQCDLMVWAELENAKLSIDPKEVAEQYKKAGGSIGDFAAAAKPKKKVSYAKGLEIVGSFVAFTDPEPGVQAFVREVWVQAILDFATSGNTVSTTLKRTEGSGEGSAFNPEAIEECRNYVRSIQDSTWGCMQHMAADYLAHVIAAGEVKDASDASKTTWSKKLATSEYARKIPFYSVINAVPDAMTKDPKKRRYEMPTVSYRTMKALSGAAASIGKSKQLQDLGLKAVCYFGKNKAIDSRVSAGDKWLGYWETGFDGTGNIQNYCSYDDAASEMGFPGGAGVDAACAKFSEADLMTVDF